MAGAWAEVLGAAIGVQDSFFSLGGDSLSAMRSSGSSVSGFNLEISMRELLRRAHRGRAGQRARA